MVLFDGEQVQVNAINVPSIVRGATWEAIFTITYLLSGDPVDIGEWTESGKGVECQVRRSDFAPTATADVECEILDGGEFGQLRLSIPASDTTDIPRSVRRVYGDPEFFDDTGMTRIVRKPFKFTVNVLPEYTK